MARPVTSAAKLVERAQAAGFTSVEACLHTLYVERRLKLEEVCRVLGISFRTMRGLLGTYDIPVKPLGGVRRIEITPELFEEICRDGIPAVAARRGVNHTALRWHLAKLDPAVKTAVAERLGVDSTVLDWRIRNPGSKSIVEAPAAPSSAEQAQPTPQEATTTTEEPTQPLCVRAGGW